jgi:hypothetical protein
MLADAATSAYAPLPMPEDSPAPATKDDLRQFMAQLSSQIEGLYAAHERWKEELIDEVDARLRAAEESTKRYFDLAVEQIRHDLLGAHKDAVEVFSDHNADHDRRLRILERYAGLRA